MDLLLLHPMSVGALSSVLGMLWVVRDVSRARRERRLDSVRREEDLLRTRGA